MIMNINLKLSQDIFMVIFSKLPFSDLPNCRIVCKAWNGVVLDYATKSDINPNAFIVHSSDVTNQPFYYGPLRYLNPKMSCIQFDTATSVATFTFDSDCGSAEVGASCNGLLHIVKHRSVRGRCNGIWNPMTNELFEFPGSGQGLDISVYGFGFSHKTKRYKLFKVNFCQTIEVWRFGISNQWEHLGHQPVMLQGNGTYLDGVIYWFGLLNGLKNECGIYTIDVETETCETDAILDVGFCCNLKLHTFDNTICLIVLCSNKVEVWVMRAKHSWIREIVFDVLIVGLNRFNHNKVFEDKEDIYFLVGNDLHCFDKKGQRMKVKTLFNPNEKVINSVVQLEAFHFGSLQQILAGND